MLVVDDENLNIMVARTLLAAFKIEIDFAMGGKKALKMVEERIARVLLGNSIKMYQIILLDYSMPEMNGPQVAELIIRMM